MKKITISFLIVLSAGLLLVSTVWGKENRQNEKITITFMVTGTGDYAQIKETELEQTLLEEFPNIEIHVEAYPDEQYYNILNTRLSMGEGPDFFTIQPYLAGPNAVQKLASGGYLEPLDELETIQHAPEEWKDPVSYNGHVYSLSSGNMILCTYYNKEIFERENLSIPQSWSEFLETCQQLKEDGIVPIVSGNKDSYALQFGLYQIAANQVYAGNPYFNEGLANGSTHFTDPGTWDSVLDKYLLLYKNQYVQEHSLSVSSAEAIERFVQGKAAMLFSGDFQYRKIEDEMGDKLGMFPLPANDEGQPVFTVISKSGGTAVYSKGENVELCKKIFEKLHENRTETRSEVWSQFWELQKNGQYTINCNQGWKGDVEWAMEDGVSRKIGGDNISVRYITQQMQKVYDEG